VRVPSHDSHTRRIAPGIAVTEVLIIDSDESLVRVLSAALSEAGLAVRRAFTGAGGLVAARSRKPDIVLLETVLPDISGTDVCLALKQAESTRDTCVVFLSARCADADRVAGLELGADDYIAKPCNVREIVLRLTGLMRRPSHPPSGLSAVGSLLIDRPAHRVLVRGRDVRLTALELRLLCALHDAGARVQSRETLLRSVWGTKVRSTTRTVDTHIKRLRKKLGEAATSIRSVRGVGYGFDPPSDRGRP
jgi:two-component system, OmpR family, phosphate regulon response regulator PhoB